jgi:hypothetical protein
MAQVQDLGRVAAMHKIGTQSGGPQLEWQAWTQIGRPFCSFVAVQPIDNGHTSDAPFISWF